MEKVKNRFNSLFEDNLFNFTAVVVIFLVMYLLITFEVLNGYISGLVMLILIMIVMSTSLNISTGFLGQLVLGHAGFMAIGAYTAGLLGLLLRDSIQSDLLLFLVGCAGSMVFAGIAGFLVGFPALRLRGDYLGIMTLGFGEIVRAGITNFSGLTGGAQGLKVPRFMTFEMAFWTTVIVVVVIYLFMNSRHGRAILSIREDEIASESVGINITYYKMVGFIVASMFAGVGGAMFAYKEGFLAPVSFNFLKSVEIFVIVVLGGMGSISGSIVASIFLVFLPEYLRDFAQFRYLLYSSLLVFVMLFRPKGLLGKREISFVTMKDWTVSGSKWVAKKVSKRSDS